MKELIFIYNAKSGVFNAFLDWSHKMFSPNTYECNLCGITYNSFGKISKWKSFLDSKNIKKTFYYTDHIGTLDFMTEDIKPPCIFIKNNNNTIKLIINSNELNKLISADELIDKLNFVMKEFD